MKYGLLCLLLILAGCANKPGKTEFALVTEEKVYLAPETLEPCKPLNKMSVEDPTFEQVFESYVATVTQYFDCKKRQDTSIELLKKFSNKENK